MRIDKKQVRNIFDVAIAIILVLLILVSAYLVIIPPTFGNFHTDTTYIVISWFSGVLGYLIGRYIAR